MSIITVILMVFSAQAAKLEDRALMLLNAKDSKILKTNLNSLNTLKKMEIACEFELSHLMVPRSCYKLKLSKDKSQLIDQACERASIKMREPVNLAGLSKSCAEFVNKKNMDIQYTQSEANPEDFLR